MNRYAHTAKRIIMSPTGRLVVILLWLLGLFGAVVGGSNLSLNGRDLNRVGVRAEDQGHAAADSSSLLEADGDVGPLSVNATDPTSDSLAYKAYLPVISGPLPATANPNATPKARRILGYLHELPNRGSNRVISGQLGSFDSEVAHGQQRLQAVYEQTGKWVGLTGMDYRNWDRDHGANLSEPNEFLIDYWNEGGLVTVSWHANNPWTGGGSTDLEMGPGGLRELITPGTDAHQSWMIMLDDIAGGLRELQDVGVVVFWRPFHEMNGGWFWWSGNGDGEEFNELWQHMFDYFTYTKGIDNLLWAYSPFHAYDQGIESPAYYYPGEDYVDIVGLDKYKPLDEEQIWLNGYDDLVATGKPIALFEFGPSPADAGPDRPDYDYANLIRDIRNEYPKIVMFLSWEWHWAIPENDNAAGLLSDPWVITRDELPNWNGY